MRLSEALGSLGGLGVLALLAAYVVAQECGWTAVENSIVWVAAGTMAGAWLLFMAVCYWVLCTSHDDRARLHCAKILVGWLTIIAVLAIGDWLRH